MCHSNEVHSSFETGDHLRTFGSALEPAPQGFEVNGRREKPWEKLPYSEWDLCSYGGFSGHDTQDLEIPCRLDLGG